MLNAFCDGSITGSHWAKAAGKDSLPHAWSGWVIKTPDGQYVHHHSVDWGENATFSGNTAEYGAVFTALGWVIRHRPGEALVIHSDSQLIINQMSGRFQVHNELLLKLRNGCLARAAKLPRVTYKWIPREQNREADCCSKIFQLWDHPATWDEVQAYLNGTVR